MAEAPGDLEPVAVAAALRQRQASRRQHHARGVAVSAGGAHTEALTPGLDLEHALPRQQPDSQPLGFCEQGLQHDPGAIGVREQLAVLFLV